MIDNLLSRRNSPETSGHTVSEDLKYFNPRRKALRTGLAVRSSFSVTLGDEARESS